MAVADCEKSPLMATGVPMAEPKVAPREWRGKWYQIMGDFSALDIVSCFMAFKLPGLAWAWNQHRAMQFSFWRELFKFFVLTAGFFMIMHVGSCVMVMTLCPEGKDMMMSDELRHDHHGHMHGGHEMHGFNHVGRKALQADDEISQASQTDMYELEQPVMLGRDDGHFFHNTDGIPRQCLARVGPAFLALASVGIALIIMIAMFFARRRTALRERFGIKGTPQEDAALYLCCAPCALAQETRTLIHEQIHDGMWYGALPGVHPPNAQAPQAQQMQV